MDKYQNGKIYKITCNKTGMVYIGSTIQTLKTRLGKHKTDYTLTQKGINRWNREVFKVLENDDYNMELIEEYPCETKKQLLIREGEHQIVTPCINKIIAGTRKFQMKQLGLSLNKKK